MHSKGKNSKVHVKNERFYNGFDKYTAERSVDKHVGDRITDEDARLIREYIAEKEAVSHITSVWARKLATSLTGMRRFITVPYSEMSTEDVIKGIAACKAGRSEKYKRLKGNYADVHGNAVRELGGDWILAADGVKVKPLAGGWQEAYDAGPLAPASVKDFIKITKAFISWLNEAKRDKEHQINEKRLKGAASGIEGADDTPFDPEDLLTREEIVAMVDNSLTVRDKAFIMTLFESCARVGELGRMTWEDLDFVSPDYIGGMVWDSKAKCERYPSFVDAMPYLLALRTSAGERATGENFVFTDDNGEPLTHKACQKILVRAAERAIEKCPSLAGKPYHRAHLIRHSSATVLVNEGKMRIEDLCLLLWGKTHSPMVEIYVNRSRMDAYKAQLKTKGVKGVDEKAVAREPWLCPICKKQNGADVRFCPKCGRPAAVDDDMRDNPMITIRLSDLEQHVSEAVALALDKDEKHDQLIAKPGSWNDSEGDGGAATPVNRTSPGGSGGAAATVPRKKARSDLS
jgi:integrase/recombinase XerD